VGGGCGWVDRWVGGWVFGACTRSELRACSGQFSLAALTVLAPATLAAVGADARAPAVLALAPLSLMIVLFIVLARNKLRIPLEGTYSGEM